MTKPCGRCKEELPAGEFRVQRRNGKERLNSYCRACERAYSKEYAHRNRKRIRAYKRQYAQEVMASPGTRDHHREYSRRMQAKYRATPEGREKERIRRQRYRAKVSADPEKRAARLESERMGYRLRQERRGHIVTRRHEIKSVGKRPENVVPAEPLARFLRVYMGERGMTAMELGKQAGVDPSGIQAILAGRKPGVFVSTADALLVPLGFTYRAVYPDVD